MNYVAVAVPFFIVAMAVEFAFGYFAKRQTYRLADTVNSLQLGTISRLNDVLRLGFSAVVFGWLVGTLGIPQWSMQSAWQWIVAFIAYDFCYYWKHRKGHEWRILWASHVAHHQSEEFNLSTALRQTGTDYIGFVFYIPMYLMGVPAPVVVTVGSLNLIYQFWVHTEHIRRLGWLEWVLVTPMNHRVHHARNPEYLDKNYGGVFILWDRIFRTYKAEDPSVPCEYGITTGLFSWNPVWANFHSWIDTARIAWRTQRWRDKLGIWFRAPAWLPDDMRATKSMPPHGKLAKFDPPLTTFARVYNFVQLWAMTFASLGLLAIEKDLPRTIVLALYAWIVFSMYVQGDWLEARANALRMEIFRLVAGALMAAVIYVLRPELKQLGMQIAAYLSLSGAALLFYNPSAPRTASVPP